MSNRIESKIAKKSRLAEVIRILEINYPEAEIQLEFENPFELLVATILSAQCTDERVNKVTQKLFKKYRSPEDYLLAEIEALESDIFSTGYYKAKARHIKEASKAVIEVFKGIVPNNMDDLLTIPGVGRKTANVVLGHCFDVPGIVVDTHVSRISQRMGFVDSANPEKIEFQLMELMPKAKWTPFTHFLIRLGRQTCSSRKPKCEVCPLAHLCPKLPFR